MPLRLRLKPRVRGRFHCRCTRKNAGKRPQRGDEPNGGGRGVDSRLHKPSNRNGIDISDVNTLIIEDADKLGLSQLHQIRRQGRASQRHAYAYLTYRKGKILTEVAEKRLNAVREFAEFGAGFKIAMRDLEIRGAGNLLGHAQSGHMMTVGYTMYLKLLEEAVLEERGEKPKEVECTADISVSAGIPDIYIQDAGQRMDLYRASRLSETEEDASDLIDELCERYGDISEQRPLRLFELPACAPMPASWHK